MIWGLLVLVVAALFLRATWWAGLQIGDAVARKLGFPVD